MWIYRPVAINNQNMQRCLKDKFKKKKNWPLGTILSYSNELGKEVIPKLDFAKEICYFSSGYRAIFKSDCSCT